MEHSGPHFVFFGTSEFSVLVLEELKKNALLPELIVSQPDRPKGRKLVLTPPPVKEWALRENISIIQPENLDEIPNELKIFSSSEEWDVYVVVSYGNIIPKDILDIPIHGAVNVHPSLLPKFRGASPIQSAILYDEKETGVTIMLLDEKMDHGPILAQASVAPEQWPPSYDELEALLGHVGGELLVETLLQHVNGDIAPEEQEHDKATYVEKITKEDGLIDLKDDAYQNYLKIQAFSRWPGTYFFVEKEGKQMRIKIRGAEFADGVLTITRIIPEGKNEMNYSDFNS